MQKLGPNQAKWVEALESGDFEQGQLALKKDNKYCCLGVAAEIFKTNNVKINVGWVGTIIYDGCEGVAPEYVMQALSLNSELGDRSDGSRGTSLYALNDYGHTFSEIASILRTDPSAYFTKES